MLPIRPDVRRIWQRSAVAWSRISTFNIEATRPHSWQQRHRVFQFSPNKLIQIDQQKVGNASRGSIVTIKSVVIPLEIDYLEQAAKERGISRTKLVRIVMEKVVRDELVSEIVSDDDLAADTPQPRYRRFRA